MGAWDRFASYCADRHLRALPADYTTVAGYVGWLHARGTVAHGSLSGYLAPLDTLHELAGYEPPTRNPIFQRLRKGYQRLQAASVGSMPAVIGPLPAAVMDRALKLATTDPTAAQRRTCAGLLTAFLMFNRPGAAAAMRAVDCVFGPEGLHVQQAFHKSETRTGSRVAFTIPVHPLGYQHDPVLCFLRSYRADFLAAGGRLFSPLFAPLGATLSPRVTSRWLEQVLTWLQVAPPVGVKWRGKSIRSGAASAANSIGVPLPVVAAYMEHKETATTARHYVDARTLPTAAAWAFFGRYISDWTGIPGPVRRGGYPSGGTAGGTGVL